MMNAHSDDDTRMAPSTHTSLMNQDLFAAPRKGSAPAVQIRDEVLSYAELDGLAAGHVSMLTESGATPGDRIGVWTTSTLETIVALYAHAKFGFTSVPFNSGLGERELAHMLTDAAPRLIVGPADSLGNARAAGASTLPTSLSRSNAPQHLRSVASTPLLILYTSGTTGAPKGAVITASNAASNLDALADAWYWTADDTVVHALPLFHVHGLVLGLFGAWRRGGCVRFVPKFDEEALGAALARGPSLLFAVPTMYHRLIAAASTSANVVSGLQAARVLVSGSAGMPMRDHARLTELTGKHAIERYGLTETLINTSVRVGHAPTPGRVGPPLTGVELRLVDDARTELSALDDATLGEIAVRGPNVFAGYLNREDATRAVIDENGFFYTGDLATRDERGSLRIVGRRATDLIKTGGYKVGAGEVEAAILEHASVSECAVIGVEDEDLGERIVAYVVRRHGMDAVEANALVDHVSSLISGHKRPRHIEFVNALPRNAMGKILKSELKKMWSKT